ncbi:MAG: hypothetical protein JWP57_3774 [Spirosoma sp.]|nr:hypothetical protein [Spirosoma sp.]
MGGKFLASVRAQIRRLGLTTLFVLLLFKSMGQISPPGLDGARVVSWVALGFTQTINASWSLTTYAGTSTQSSLADAAFWRKPAISVLNQEVGYQFSRHWQIVVAGSLRTQSLYEEAPPYEAQQPGVRNEFRTYARLFFRHQQGKVSWAHSFRPEHRQFFTSEWQHWPTPLQIRLRWKSQLSFPVNTAQTTQLVFANEVLTSVSQTRMAPATELRWGAYRFTEDRFSMFVRRLLKKPHVFIDAGVMHQIWWDTNDQKLRYTAYLSADVLFRNPFSKGQTVK